MPIRLGAPRLTDLEIDLSLADSDRAWSAARNALGECARSGSLAAWSSRGDPGHGALARAYVTRADAAMRDLVAAGRRLDAEATSTAVGRLVGLGAGLTPAGDDLLVGFVSGLMASAGGGEDRDDFSRRFVATIHGRARATTPTSAAWLTAATRGHASEPLVSVARCIASGACEAAEGAVALAAGVGHTSGSEGVLGLLIGLDTFARVDVA